MNKNLFMIGMVLLSFGCAKRQILYQSNADMLYKTVQDAANTIATNTKILSNSKLCISDLNPDTGMLDDTFAYRAIVEDIMISSLVNKGHMVLDRNTGLYDNLYDVYRPEYILGYRILELGVSYYSGEEVGTTKRVAEIKLDVRYVKTDSSVVWADTLETVKTDEIDSTSIKDVEKTSLVNYPYTLPTLRYKVGEKVNSRHEKLELEHLEQLKGILKTSTGEDIINPAKKVVPK